jgi:lipopolysaccharide transport system ATP-binding protein
MTTPAIRVESLGKLYALGVREKKHDTLTAALLSWLRAPARNYRNLRRLSALDETSATEVIWALRDVSFEVASGEVVGIIGRNGAGKSTLLKILSRITEPTRGRATITGRVASLLEVGTGFHPELTGRENVYLNGTILGMSKTEIDRRFDEIVEFSGVERFLDTPVKRYSSGMQVRLAFSVAAHLEPEILVVDEVLAVGDAEFQAKCLGKMKSVSEGGRRTVLFVSHNMSAVRRLCERCVLLDHGQVETIGPSDIVVRRYLSLGTTGGRELRWPAEDAPGSDEITFQSVRILDARDSTDSALSTGDELAVEIRYRIHLSLANLRIAMSLFTDDGVEVLATSDFHQQGERRIREPGDYISVCLIPGGLLNTGRYTISIDADIPRIASLARDIQLGFDIEELAINQLGITIANRPSGVIHPHLRWTLSRHVQPLAQS